MSPQGVIRPQFLNLKLLHENTNVLLDFLFSIIRWQWLEPMLTDQLDHQKHISMKFYSKLKYLHSRKNGIEKIICKLAVILSRPQCVNVLYTLTQHMYKQRQMPLLCDRSISPQKARSLVSASRGEDITGWYLDPMIVTFYQVKGHEYCV